MHDFKATDEIETDNPGPPSTTYQDTELKFNNSPAMSSGNLKDLKNQLDDIRKTITLKRLEPKNRDTLTIKFALLTNPMTLNTLFFL